MIGHCLGAAGGLEAIATVKAITTGWVHPTINQFVCSLSFCSIMFFYSRLYCSFIILIHNFAVKCYSSMDCFKYTKTPMQNPEPAVEFDTVPNTKQQHEVNVGKILVYITLQLCLFIFNNETNNTS